MKNLIFTKDELTEIEALEVRGGAASAAAPNIPQTGCVNLSIGCGAGTVSQIGCSNAVAGCTTQLRCQKPPRPVQSNCTVRP